MCPSGHILHVWMEGEGIGYEGHTQMGMSFMFGGGEWGPDVARGNIPLIVSKWQGFYAREGYPPCPIESFNEERRVGVGQNKPSDSRFE